MYLTYKRAPQRGTTGVWSSDGRLLAVIHKLVDSYEIEVLKTEQYEGCQQTVLIETCASTALRRAKKWVEAKLHNLHGLKVEQDEVSVPELQALLASNTMYLETALKLLGQAKAVIHGQHPALEKNINNFIITGESALNEVHKYLI